MPSEVSSSDLRECGHLHANHHWHAARGDACIGNRNLCSCRMFRAKGDFVRCRCDHFQMNHRPFTEGGCINCSCDAFKLKPEEPEPPLTPEEEEQAPEDEALPPPEGPECEKCVCGHIVPEHDINGRWCAMEGCECSLYRTEPDFELPPQPDRRPPYAVAYSVQGHLYEVALPGDATVQATDGALIIRHHLGPVAGIVQVLPVINKESNG